MLPPSAPDGLQVLRPDTKNEQEVVDFFQKVAKQTDLPLVLHGEFSHPLLDKLLTIDSIVAMKEDVGLEYYIQVQRKYGDRLAIFEGGPEYAFLVAHPYGAQASYTTLGTFVPQITQSFWEALNRKDIPAAYAIVKKYEHPFFDRWSHAFWRSVVGTFWRCGTIPTTAAGTIYSRSNARRCGILPLFRVVVIAKEK